MTNSAVAIFIRYPAMLGCMVGVCLLLVTSLGVSGQTVGEHEQEDQEQMNSVLSRTVLLNPITVGDQVVWAFQALLAPELLEEAVPLYAYSPEHALNLLARAPEQVAEYEIDLSWHVGTAFRADDDQWEAYPVPAQGETMARILQHLSNQQSRGDLSHLQSEVMSDYPDHYIVSNLPLANLGIEEKFWIPKADWSDALSSIPIIP